MENMSESTKNGLIKFIDKIKIPFSIFVVCVFSLFLFNNLILDKDNANEVETTISANPDLNYYKSKLSDLYDKVILFKSDLTKYGETDEVKKEYVLITKSHSEFSLEINQYNTSNPNDKIKLPSLEDFKNLSFDELLVIMFES